MCATSIYVALLPWQCHDFEVIAFSFSYLFIYLPMAVPCQHFIRVNKRVWNDDDKRIRRGDTLVPTLSTVLNLSQDSASLSIIPKPARSFRRGDNADKAGLTSISLELIWCQSLFICCLLKIVELIQAEVSFFWGGEKNRERKWEKRGVIPLRNFFFISSSDLLNPSDSSRLQTYWWVNLTFRP